MPELEDLVMRNPTAATGQLDIAGVAASTVCAIHCALLPFAAGTLAALGAGWLQKEGWDWLFITTSFAIGLFSLVPACRLRHRNPRCLVLFSCGMLSLLVGRLTQQPSLHGISFAVVGAVLVASAHVANRLFCARCQGCATDSGSPG